MTQTRLGSLIEAAMNIGIGYVVAILSQILIFPLFGIHIPLSDNLLIGLWFTGISLVRSYVIRRWFNARLHRAAVRMAGHHPECEAGCAYGRDVGMPEHSCFGECQYKKFTN